MKAMLLLGIAPLALTAPALAQSMDHSTMHHGTQPPASAAEKPAADPHAGHDVPTKDQEPVAADPHAGHDMSDMATPKAEKPAADPHAGHDMSGMSAPADQAKTVDPHAGHDMTGAASDSAVGNEPAPAPPADHAADRFFPRTEMDAARAQLRREHGGGTVSMIQFDLVEYQARSGRDGFRVEGEGWFGGDINRLVVKTEIEGAFGERLENLEVQALYSRAIGPYFNLQAGVRQDFRPTPSRTYATIGFEGLAPYWFEVEGAVFLSHKGDVLARLGGYYDQRITQRLILQPRAELNFAAQDVPETGTGSGLSDAELGLRLRYEIKREFAPYIGVEWARKAGDTARYARIAGEDPNVTSFVIGVRTWF